MNEILKNQSAMINGYTQLLNLNINLNTQVPLTAEVEEEPAAPEPVKEDPNKG